MEQLAFVNQGVKPKYWYIQIAASATNRYNINIKLLTEINFIIGIRAYNDGIGPNNTALIATGILDDYFLNLVAKNSANIFDRMRLDVLSGGDLGGSDVKFANPFFPVNIKGADVDLQNSYITNPGAASNALMFGFLYI